MHTVKELHPSQATMPHFLPYGMVSVGREILRDCQESPFLLLVCYHQFMHLYLQACSTSLETDKGLKENLKEN